MSNPYQWIFDANSGSLPSPGAWCKEVLGDSGVSEEEAIGKLLAVATEIADHPAKQDWLDEMLEWSFSSRRSLEVLLGLGAKTKSYHLGQLFNASWVETLSSLEIASLARRFVEVGASPSRCSHAGAEFPMEPMLAMAFRRLPVESALAVSEVLLAAGAPIDGPGPGWSHPSGLKRPVEVAAELGKEELFRWCLEKGASLELVPDPTFQGCAPGISHVLRELSATHRKTDLEKALPEGKLASGRPRF